MFSNLLSSLQLSPTEEADQKDSAAQPSDAAGKGAHVSFWGVAAAVAGTVRATADDFVNTVKQTDWQSELKNFGKEVAQDTKSLSNNAATLVDQLPLQLDAAGNEVYMGEGSEHFRSISPNKESEDAVAAKLEEVGSALASFGRTLMAGTQELVEQVREAVETEIVAVVKDQKPGQRPRSTGNSGSTSRLATTSTGKYNRFEAEVTAMQRDSSTYCDEPEDKEDFAAWKADFQLASMKSEINKVVKQNAFMAELQSRIVPLIVEYDDFWTRYFYRLHKLQLKEAQRQELHSRMSKADDVEVSWDDEDAQPSARATPDKQPTTAAAGAPATSTASEPAVSATAPESKPTANDTSVARVTEPAAELAGAAPTQAAARVVDSSSDTTATAEKLPPDSVPTDKAVIEEAVPIPVVQSTTSSSVDAREATAVAASATDSEREKHVAATPVVETISADALSAAVAVAAAAAASEALVKEAAQVVTSSEAHRPASRTPASDSGQTSPTPADASHGEGVACKPGANADRDGSTPDTASDIASPEWCVISNASASDAGVNSIDTRVDRDPHAASVLSELKDDEDDEELAVTPGEVAPGEDDDEDVDEDWGNWG